MKFNFLINGPSLNSKSGSVKQLIVFLHGWGSNGDDLIQLAPLFSNQFPDAFFLSPNGPEECPQNPFEGRQWFGLEFFSDGTLDRSNTPTKLNIAAEHLNKFLDNWKEKFSLNSADIFLIGFSQGSMLALEVGIKRKIGGILCYSGSFVSSPNSLIYKPNIMLIHGEIDEVIPLQNMINAEKKLRKLGANISTLKCKSLGHSINDTGINKGIEFIKKCIMD